MQKHKARQGGAGDWWLTQAVACAFTGAALLIVALTLHGCATLSKADTWLADAADQTTQTVTRVRTVVANRVTAKPQVLLVESMEGCAPCEDLADWLVKSGVRVNVVRTEEAGARAFPTVRYSDGVSDQGQRIMDRACRLPRTVMFRKWTGAPPAVTGKRRTGLTGLTGLTGGKGK